MPIIQKAALSRYGKHTVVSMAEVWQGYGGSKIEYSKSRACSKYAISTEKVWYCTETFFWCLL